MATDWEELIPERYYNLEGVECRDLDLECLQDE